MKRVTVTGIGGFFFRAAQPSAINQWYKEHLGIELAPADYAREPWLQESGPTVFTAFPTTTEHFGNKNQSWMINFRVPDLDAVVTQLRSSGVAVALDPETYPNGRFARLNDPEGNPIELWEPRAVNQSEGRNE